jgi:hypothetical protein
MRVLYVPHLLLHETSIFNGISQRPVIITAEYRALGKGAVTTYFNVLGLTRPAQAGIGSMTSQMLSESATIRLIK